MLTMYNVVSADGYIAQINGKDLRQDLWDNFLKLCKEHGTLVMGRKTYDSIQKYDHRLVSDLEALPIKRIVISRDENFVPKNEYTVFHTIKDAQGYFEGAMLSSGPTLNSALLKEGLISRVILDKMTKSMCENLHINDLQEGKHDQTDKDHLKDCIKYFNEDSNPDMKLVSTTDIGGGIVRSVYTI